MLVHSDGGSHINGRGPLEITCIREAHPPSTRAADLGGLLEALRRREYWVVRQEALSNDTVGLLAWLRGGTIRLTIDGAPRDSRPLRWCEYCATVGKNASAAPPLSRRATSWASAGANAATMARRAGRS